MAETAIEFKGVSKRFKGNEYDSVSNVNLKIEKGTFVTILGTWFTMNLGCAKL